MINDNLIERYLLTNDLSTYDPYDIWKTNVGVKVKQLYYKNKYIGIIPAGVLTIYDLYINNNLRIGYKKQEYPIVRAQAALALLNLYKKEHKDVYIEYAKKHIDWLIKNSSKGYSGYCWGISFEWVSKNGTYDVNMPHVTHTPYVLEAIVKYQHITKTNEYDEVIKSIFSFLENDIKIMLETDTKLAMSYAPVDEPRIVINANSYIMYMYVLLLEYFPERKKYIRKKIKKIYKFILDEQKENGSWLYYADNKNGNFIDCFHSAFVLKNIYKTNSIVSLENSEKILKNGYKYLENYFFDSNKKLFKRFTISDKPSLIIFDLYDNAEMLYILKIMKEYTNMNELKNSINNNFIKHENIFSKIIKNGIKIDKNTLRWAVMPYIYNLSEVI
jgi:hypothetical protein